MLEAHNVPSLDSLSSINDACYEAYIVKSFYFFILKITTFLKFFFIFQRFLLIITLGVLISAICENAFLVSSGLNNYGNDNKNTAVKTVCNCSLQHSNAAI